MATKAQELAVKITADASDAVKAIDTLERKAKPLEDGVDVEVKATGADKAAADLEKAAKAGQQLDKALAGVDPVHVRDVGGPAALAAQAFEKVAEEAEQAGKAIADVKPGAGLDEVAPAAQRVKAGLEETNKAADGAKNAMANLAGNSAQSLGGMLGPLGDVGTAIGQVVEYTADARLGGLGMTDALKGVAGMVGPLAALSIATLAVTNAMERHKARQAELLKINAELVESFVDGTGVVEAFGNELDDAFSSGTASDVQVMTKLLKDRLDPKEFQRVAVAFGEVGVSIEDMGSVIPAVDADFQAFAATQLKTLGLSEKQAEGIAHLIDKYDHLTSVSDVGQGKVFLEGITDPKQLAAIDKMTHGLQEFADQAQNVKLQGVATDALNMARAFDGARVAAAEEGGGLPVEQYLRYRKAVDEATRATEEGAKASAESGTILDQVGRQVEKAADMAADAMDKAKAAQDNWLIQNVDYQGAVDSFTDALEGLGKAVDDGRQKTGALSGDFEGNSKVARDNRDALGEVYSNAVAMNDAMKDAGFSVDGAKVAMDNAAQSAYEMALQMGLPQEEAQKIKDKILGIPTLVTTDVKYTEQGYEDRLAEQERLERDIHNTVYFAGVVDRSLQNAINTINWNAPPGTVITPSSAPAAGPMAMTTVVPVAPAAMAAPVTRSQSVNVNVSLSGGIVADTFELQRVVERAARAGARLGGRRP